MEAHPPENPTAFNGVRWVGRLILAIMVASVLYAGWIAVANWYAIRI